MQSHKDLMVWQKSIEFVSEIYKITQKFPSSEIYGLTNQIRRSAVSIPSNIAEGAARSHSKELVQFLYISLGSASELDTQLLISKNLGFIKQEEFEQLNTELNSISKMLVKLIKSVKEKV